MIDCLSRLTRKNPRYVRPVLCSVLLNRRNGKNIRGSFVARHRYKKGSAQILTDGKVGNIGEYRERKGRCAVCSVGFVRDLDNVVVGRSLCLFVPYSVFFFFSLLSFDSQLAGSEYVGNQF